MLKKIVFLFLLCIILFIGYVFTYENSRLSDILKSEFGDNHIYLEKIDEDISIGGPISIETYIFKIKNKNNINCRMSKEFVLSKKELIHFEKRYIRAHSQYCEKYSMDDLNRTVKVIIQDDILALNVFID